MNAAGPALPDDDRLMAAAIALSRRNLGRTAPNPSVGVLVVKGGVIVGRGVTAPGGRPHAERIALDQAGDAARGATVYVSLEPCARRSVSGAASCTDALIAAGVARVVIAADDPSPLAAGQGAQRLAAAGIAVRQGVQADEARRVNLGHILRVTANRPAVSLKLAQSRDGFAGTLERGPVQITGAVAGMHTHVARAQADALMVGAGTVRGDNPKLNVRIAGLEDRAPIRVILDSTLRLPADYFVVRTARIVPTWVFCGWKADPARAAQLRDAGVIVTPVTGDSTGALSLEETFGALAARGITRLMVEGGPTLANALAARDLIDDFTLMTGPEPLGQGATALMPDLRRWMVRDDVAAASAMMWGEDRAQLYERIR